MQRGSNCQKIIVTTLALGIILGPVNWGVGASPGLLHDRIKAPFLIRARSYQSEERLDVPGHVTSDSERRPPRTKRRVHPAQTDFSQQNLPEPQSRLPSMETRGGSQEDHEIISDDPDLLSSVVSEESSLEHLPAETPPPSSDSNTDSTDPVTSPVATDSSDHHHPRADQADTTDQERYSRQVYTLGARAHGILRQSTTMYLDGPPSSGLLWECAKNLALSGVARIVLLYDRHGGDGGGRGGVESATSSSSTAAAPPSPEKVNDRHSSESDSLYHSAILDDLGRAYLRAARSELALSDAQDPFQHDNEKNEGHNGAEMKVVPPELQVLMLYLQRLNPHVHVSLMERSALLNNHDSEQGPGGHHHEHHGGNRMPHNHVHVLVCLDRPIATRRVIEWNQWARQEAIPWPLIAAETAGFYGRLFCDLGPSFEVVDSDGESPLLVPLDHIEEVDTPALPDESTTRVLVHTVSGEKHDVSSGDIIEFVYGDGEADPVRGVVANVKTPFLLEVQIKWPLTENQASVQDDIRKINSGAISFRRIKLPQTIAFLPLPDALKRVVEMNDASLFTACDLEKSWDTVRRDAVMACFQALPVFIEREGRFPTEADAVTLSEVAQEVWKTEHTSTRGDEWMRHCRLFSKGCAASFSLLQSVFGALAAQEALKAATGLYVPVQQILVYDLDEIIVKTTTPHACPTPELDGIKDSREPFGLRYLLGDKIVDELQKKRIFIAGAGAIGCELLKNLAALGVATKPDGKVILTDMDTIEKSNLSRQLLFRDSDIGKFKSVAAQEAAGRFSPFMTLESHSSRVGEDQQSPFDPKFWAQHVDVVLNALDNVEARLYMDRMCVANQKALVDAGTMGSKGNVQVVVPHKSESYASSIDPPEPSIPVCTLKKFPYAISHTIQWGRDLFDGLFYRRPTQVNEFIESSSSDGADGAYDQILNEKGSNQLQETEKELSEDLNFMSKTKDDEATKGRALEWAARLAYDLFFQGPSELLREHPLGSLDEDGAEFWSGSRRPPTPTWYSASESVDKNLIEFVRYAARLRVESLLGPLSQATKFSTHEIVKLLSDFHPSADANHDGKLDLAPVAALFDRWTPLEFEKDDDSNGHVAFITAASNLRAINYGIPPVDSMETRRVAGKIVPAMITTTALVSALSCIELIKLVQDAPLESYRNSFVNLALPFFAFTVPLPAESLPGVGKTTYTLWDRLVIREDQKSFSKGGLTLKSLIRRIKKLCGVDSHEVEVLSISLGPLMLYADFLHEDSAILGSSIWEVIDDAKATADAFESDFSRDQEEVVYRALGSGGGVDLTVVVEDLTTGEEVELPTLRLERFEV